MNTKLKTVAWSIGLLASGMIFAGHAQASAYATASNYIKDGFVVGLVDGTPQVDSTGTPVNGPYIVFGTAVSESSSSATLNGSGPANSVIGTNPNAPVSFIGLPRANENVDANGYYNLFGPTDSSNYSWGDANVVSEQTLTGTPIVARAAAESNVNGTAKANADGTDKSSTIVNLPVNITNACGTGSVVCRISFSFLADPYMRALLDLDADLGSVARSTLALSITLTDINGTEFFNWTPNGRTGGINGGTETADVASLNRNLTALVAGQDIEYSSPYANNAFGSYAAYTDPLSTGAYILTLATSAKTDVTRIPEPGTLALFGFGLAAAGLMRRRKQA